MFFFMTGMTIFSKAVVGGLAHALALFFGDVQLQIGALIVSGGMIPDLNQVVVWGLIFAIGLYGFFSAIGWKLWQQHYPDRKSRIGFLGFITLSYWLGLILTVLMV
jgi:hypothetical protein